jgi:hypothetical protein
MKTMRLPACIAIGVGLAGGQALAGTTNYVAAVTTNATPATIEEMATNTWSFSASLYTYIVSDDDDYLQTTFTADRDWLHLEARYNYEDLDTGSAWMGYNLSGGENFTWEFTPMLGGVFGDTTGIAPGYELTLGWRKLELYSEGEYVFDTGDSSGSFFYNWSELTLSPTDWMRVGMVTQRTRIHNENRDIERGPLLGFSYQEVDLTAYVFDPFSDDPTFVFAVAVSF